MSNTLNLTRDEIHNLFAAEGVSSFGLAFLGKLLDAAFTPAENKTFIDAVNTAAQLAQYSGSPLIYAVKMARSLRPDLGLAEAKALVERIVPAHILRPNAR